MAAPRRLDLPSAATILVTLGLFIVAVFLHGFTQGLLLEAGVFLVSVKLILMSYKNAAAAAEARERLGRIEELLTRRDSSGWPPAPVTAAGADAAGAGIPGSEPAPRTPVESGAESRVESGAAS